MARTKTLRHVASGLRDAFVGRHNDLDGYWALGKLYAAADPAMPSVVLDLLDGSAVPSAPDCLAAARRWADFLAQALAAHGIARFELARADVLVEFDIVPEVPIPRLSPDVAWPGDPFRCTVTLGDRAGRPAQARAWGYCWPHDPGRERSRYDSDWDLLARDACIARVAGRHGEAMRILEGASAPVDGPVAPGGVRHARVMREWQALAAVHPPARVALVVGRDEQVRRVLAGDNRYGGHGRLFDADYSSSASRLALAIELNAMLEDPGSTRTMVEQLARDRPAMLRAFTWQFLPALLACGDFALAERLQGDPLAGLGQVNALAREHGVYPGPRKISLAGLRLAETVRDVRAAAAVSRGLGRPDEAESLYSALLAGLENEALRRLARAELDVAGAIELAMQRHHEERDAARAARVLEVEHMRRQGCAAPEGRSAA